MSKTTHFLWALAIYLSNLELTRYDQESTQVPYKFIEAKPT